MQSIVTLVLGFLVTPLLLETYGASRIGLNELIREWTGLLTVLGSYAILPGAQVLLVGAFYRNELGKFKSILLFSLKWSLVAAVGSALLGALLFYFVPGLFRVEGSVRTELLSALLLIGVMVSVSPIKISDLVVEAVQRSFLLRIALIVQGITVPVLALSFGRYSNALVGLLWATFIGNLLYFGISLYGALPFLRKIGMHSITPVSGKEFYSVGISSFVAMVLTQVALSLDKILLGAYVGAGVVVVYLYTQRILELIGRQIGTVATSTWVGLQDLRLTSSTQHLSDRVLELIKLKMVLGVCLLGVGASYNELFVTLWLGEQYYAGDWVTITMCLNLFLIYFSMLFQYLLDGAGLAQKRLVSNVAFVVINVVSSYLLLPLLGILGVCLGTSIAYLLTDAWYIPWAACRQFHFSLKEVYKTVGKIFLFGIPWVGAVWLFSKRPHSDIQWGRLFLESGTLGAGGLFIAWWLVFSPAERKIWGERCSASIRELKHRLNR